MTVFRSNNSIRSESGDPAMPGVDPDRDPDTTPGDGRVDLGPRSADAPTVEIDDVGLGYPTRSGSVRPALAGVDLIVPGGRFVAVIGPSGCGKSTLLRLIGGLERPGSGTITVGGRDPEAVRADGVIGLVPQSPALLPWRSVADNVALLDQLGRWKPRRLGPDGVGHWLKRVGLTGEADLLPHQLSGGMQQRVALARAFALEPSVMLLDEPFSALDEMTRHHMQVLLSDLCREQDTTVVFVTHSIDEAVKLADRVVVMSASPGRVIDDVAIDLANQREAGVEDSAEFRTYAARIRSALIESPGART